MQVHDHLLKNFALDEDAGVVFRRSDGRCSKAGDPVPSKVRNGYMIARLSIEGRRTDIMYHRLVWLLKHGNWPECAVDHINRDRLDNRPSNLREAIGGINQQNREAFGYHAYKGKWRVHIRLGGRKYSMGGFPSEEMARRAYVALKKEFHEGCSHWKN